MAAGRRPSQPQAASARRPKVLTEEDLLKAPERDYMNEARLAFFGQRLNDVRDQILRNTNNTGEHLRENEVTTDPSATGRRSRRSTHSSCARATGNESC